MNREVKITATQALKQEEITQMKQLYDQCFPRLRADTGGFEDRLALSSGAVVLFARVKNDTADKSDTFDGYAVVSGGALLLLVVAAHKRGQGIGSALLKHAEELIFRDHDTITLGRDGGTYLLIGVPKNSSGAWDFFERRGYVRSWTACDLVADLRTYSPRPDLCYSGGDIVIRPRGDTDSERAQVKACGDRIDEGWGEYFASSDGVIVADRGGELIGAVIAGTDSCMFSQSLPDTGELGCLGVLEQYRGCGVGASLCAASLDKLAKAGLSGCFIGYTWLDKWYGKFGAVKYAEYEMGEKRR
jgi:Acetyltransferases